MGQSNRSRYTTRRAAAKPEKVGTRISIVIQKHGSGLPDCPTLAITDQGSGSKLFICLITERDGSQRFGCITTLKTPGGKDGEIKVHGGNFEARQALQEAIGWLQFPSVRVATQPTQVAA